MRHPGAFGGLPSGMGVPPMSGKKPVKPNKFSNPASPLNFGFSLFTWLSLRSFLAALLCLPLGLAAAAPGWWAPHNVTSVQPADNYAVANQGQLKNIARKAYDALQEQLPSSAWTAPQGASLAALIRSWYNDDALTAVKTTGTDPYAAVNQGQLKSVALPFYQVLLANGYISSLPVWADPNHSGADHYALANLGQVKNLFTFSLDVNMTGLRLWLRADAGVVSDTNGNINAWQDQSGNGNNAVQGNLGSQPVVVANQLNGQPVVRFDATAGPQVLQLPAGFMGTATAAEVFVVLKAAADNPGGSHVLWNIGTNGYGSPYPYFNGHVIDNFASTTDHDLGDLTVPIDQFNVYNVSSQAGAWVAQLNGDVVRRDPSNTVAFTGVPLLGGGGTTWSGDIAELIIYDHVLTADERAAVTGYLASKYALGASAPVVSGLGASAISSTQVLLRWQLTSPGTGTQVTIQRRVTGTTTWATVGHALDSQSFIDSTAAAGTNYDYQVSAESLGGGESGASAPASVTTPAAVTAMPLAGQRLWLRADAGTGVVGDGGRVTWWLDQSGNNNDATQVTAASQPVVVAGQLNGQPVVRFDASVGPQVLQLPAGFMGTATAAEVFVVLKAAADNPGGSHVL